MMLGLKEVRSGGDVTARAITLPSPDSSRDALSPLPTGCAFPAASATKSAAFSSSSSRAARSLGAKLLSRAPYFCSQSRPARTEGHSSRSRAPQPASRWCRARRVGGMRGAVAALGGE